MKLTSKNIRKYIDNIKPIEIFDIDYTPEEKSCIDTFDLKTQSTYNNYADNNLEDLESYINTLGDNNKESVELMSQIIKNITEIVMEGYQKDCFWLTIRSTQYTNDYDIPRYHCDGKYMGFYFRDDLSKFVTVLQGSGTLFIKTNKKQKEFFICTEKEEHINSIKNYEKKNNYDSKSDPNFNSKLFTIINDDDIRIRTELDKKLQGERIQASNYQAAIFLAGNQNTCGIHSEPPKHRPRMFLSIVPGSREEIDGWISAQSKKKGGYKKYLKYKSKYLQLKNIFTSLKK